MTATSVYGDAWLALYRIMGEAVWPAPKAGSKRFEVCLCDFGKEQPAEGVLVHTSADQAEFDWATIAGSNSGMNETFTTPIDLWTNGPRLQSPVEAIARIKELSAVFESVMRTSNAQLNKPVELADRLVWWKVARTSPMVGHLQDGGYGAAVRYTVAVSSRI